MAGPEDEADFRDADDGAAAAAAPPPSSPSSSASTLSKPKPAAAAGGLGKRLLAFSAAIGRPSTPSSPKPPPPPTSNVGLGLLLDLGPKPSTDGSDASAHDLHLPPAAAPQQQQQGEEEALEEQGATAQRAQLALQHGEGQVVGHDVGGVREELAVLVPMEEEGRLAAEGGEKEGVADGCSENRNGFSLQDQEEEGEQRTSDELGAVMEDQEVMEKEGATKYCNAVGDQSNDVVERCAGDAPSAIRDDDVVEDQVLVEKEGSTKYYTAVEDQSNNAAEQCTSDAPKAVKDDNIVYDQEVLEQEGAANYYTTVEDQSNNIAEQCTGVASRAVKDDNIVYDQEVLEQEGATKYYTAVEDQNNNIAEQCTGVASRAVKDDNIMEAQVVVEKEGSMKYYTVVEDQSNDAAEQCTGDAPRVIKDDNIVEDQEVVVQEGTAKCYQSNNVAEQCTGFALRAVKGDSIMEAQVVVEKEGSTKYYTVVEDQCYDAAEQCTDDAPRVVKDENTVEDQEVVVQEGTTKYYSTVEDQSNNAAEQCTDEVSRATKDDNVLEEKEKAIKQGGPVGILGAAEYGIDVGSQEEDVLVEGQGEDGISVQDQHKVVEQCRSVELGVPIGDSAVQDQEVVVVEQEQEGVTEYYGAAVEDQNNNAAVEQCTSDGLRAVMDGNVVEEREKTVEQESAIVILGSQEHEEGEEEEVVVVAEQREDGISLQNQDKVGEQCGSDQLRTTSDDNAAQDHKVVEQEGAIVERGATANGIAVEAQEKALEQSAGDKSRAMEDESAVEDKEKVVDQKSVSDKQDAIKNDSAVGSQEHGDVVVAEQGEDGISVQNQDKMVGQCTSDQLRTTTYDNAAEDYELVEQEGANVERGATADGIAVEAQEKAVEQSAGDELSTTKYENAVGDKEKVLNLGVINKQGAIKDGSAMESQEEEGDVVVAEQGEDDISVQDQDKVVEQCINDQLRTTTDDNDAEQEVSREKVRICAGYPQRPSRPNCRFYMSNGSCSYGLSCYYNHPQLKAKPEVSSFPSQQGNREVAEFLELNRVGLPIREGARNCTYFMRNGTCRYGKKCCFNHPEHVLDVQLHMPTGWDDTNLPSSPHSKKSPEHANLDDLSSNLEFLPPSIFRMLLPPQNLPSAPEEKEMKVKKDPDWSSASDDSDGCCPVDGSGGPFCKQEHVGYSEKPGRQECPFLLRFGNCKFASSCHYYHPKDKFPSKYRRKDKFPSRYHLKDPSLAEELMVYPGKPGEPECPFYMKIGSCKFGAECKFHHPKDLPPSMQAPAIPKRSFAANEHHPAAKTMLQDHMYQQQKYPERPGEPACRYYMQFGKCKFLSACVFHHPKERLQSGWRPKGPAHSDKYETWQPTNAFRSEDQCQQEQNKPGMPECPFYMKTGTCQFGSACEFYHPKHRCSSTEGVIVDRTDYETAITSQSEMMF